MTVSADGIRTLVEASLPASGLDGLELWDVEVTADTVRVLVDRAGGIDLDALSVLGAQVISPLLDAHPELTPPGAFSLEVSSPGVERTLRRPEHFTTHIGREISVKTKSPVDGSRRWQGVLRSADDERIVVEPDVSSGHAGVVEVAFDQIDRVRTVLVWGPAAKPGQSNPAAKRPAAEALPRGPRSVAFTEGKAE